MQEPKNVRDVYEIVKRVSYDKEFYVGALGDDGFYVQIRYPEADVRTGEMAMQAGRKWYVSPFATESEIVQTCLSAALASAEHQVREHFRYLPAPDNPTVALAHDSKPKAIYGPHFSADALWGICGKASSHDARQDPK